MALRGENRHLVMSEPATPKQGNSDLFISVAVFKDQEWQGFLTAEIDIRQLFDKARESSQLELEFNATQNSRNFYRTISHKSEISIDSSLKLFAQRWTLESQFSEPESDEFRFANSVLFCSLLVTYLISFLLFFTNQLKRQRGLLEKKHNELKIKHNQLNQSQAQLLQSAKLASLEEMATGIAHELNQPLQIINTNAEMGPQYLNKNNPTRLMKCFSDIQRQIERSQFIINHLRTFVRDSSIQEHQPIDVPKLLRNTLKLLEKQLNCNNIEYRLNIAPNLAEAHGNQTQLEQILFNLLVNAKDALEGIHHKLIQIRAFAKQYTIYIQIEDNGTGIQAHEQDKIFDPFFTTTAVE